MSDEQNSVLVRGEGVVDADPDIATLTLGAAVRRETPVAAFDRARELAESLVALFTGRGVERRDIQSTTVSLDPEFGQPSPNTTDRRVIGWRASSLFAVKLRDLGRIPAILQESTALLGEDAQIQGISFGLEDADALISRARAAAFSNAQRAAGELAQLAGARLGEVISIDEQCAPSPAPLQGMQAPRAMALTAAHGGSMDQIAPGQISVRVGVALRFALDHSTRP
ncbi:MAG: SIMPL domain-containing protein [Dehalococcoidia bacterium]